MKDIMSNGYRAGCNTKFFSKDGSGVPQAVMDRLNMEDSDMDTTHGSILAFFTSPGQLDMLQNEISITSRLLPWDVHAKSQNYFPGGSAMYTYFKEKYGLDAVHFGEDLRASENMEYMSQVSPNWNQTCPNHTPAHTIRSDRSPIGSFAHRARSTTRCASRARTAHSTRLRPRRT